MRTEDQIIYENGAHWVTKERFKGRYVWYVWRLSRSGTHGERVATFDLGARSEPRAIADADRREAESGRSHGYTSTPRSRAGSLPSARPRPYRIRITEDELDSLAYIGDRYTYAEVLLDALEQDDDDEELYTLSESDAWQFADAVEKEDGYLPLLGGDLAVKIQALLDNIV